MFQPSTYGIALTFMLISMLCWGSWANTMKLTPGYRFQLYYWDYVAGILLASIAFGLTLGSHGSTGTSFLAEVQSAHARNIVMALIGGVLFNIANLLLVAAIEIAGLAVAFPIGIGLALIVGACGSYIVSPRGNPWTLFGGIALVTAAIVFDALAYKLREREAEAVSTREAAVSIRGTDVSNRGVVLSLIAGLLMGLFYPFVSSAMTGPTPLGPYSADFFFSIGILLCAIPFNYLLMKRPLDGNTVLALSGYTKVPASFHLWGLLGGAIWCAGAALNFVASRSQVVGPAVSYSIGQGATMISAAWGVLIWKEFAHAPPRARRFVAFMFFFFLIGLTSIAISPLL